MKKEIYRKSMGVVNKLSEYEIQYECYNDCLPQGCPSHVAKFKYYSVSDGFSVTFDGIKHLFDSSQFRLIQDFIEKLNSKDL
jgi:hypothetical protein